jgi:uncharacterized protein with von Willebrand factor type A (vWA) domain
MPSRKTPTVGTLLQTIHDNNVLSRRGTTTITIGTLFRLGMSKRETDFIQQIQLAALLNVSSEAHSAQYQGIGGIVLNIYLRIPLKNERC